MQIEARILTTVRLWTQSFENGHHFDFAMIAPPAVMSTS